MQQLRSCPSCKREGPWSRGALGSRIRCGANQLVTGCPNQRRRAPVLPNRSSEPNALRLSAGVAPCVSSRRIRPFSIHETALRMLVNLTLQTHPFNSIGDKRKHSRHSALPSHALLRSFRVENPLDSWLHP